MSKPAIIISGVVAVLLIAILAFFFYPSSVPTSNPTSGSGQSSLPVAGSSATTSGTPGSTTSPSIESLLQSPDTIKLGPDDYLLAETASRFESQEYQITYHVPDKTYTVSLATEPLGETRQNAEQRFLSLLAVTEDQACALHVNVTTFYSVNQQYAGKNLGFSFCPGATVLPK
ncbi:MAG: hypothetical protein Q7S95_00495 [bacterium]|nr:hypothetical protein [bacterium]